MDKQHRINETYNWYADEYDKIMENNGNFEEPRRKLFEEIDFVAGERILDVPVGTGLDLPLYPRDVRVTALDLNNSMMKYARERFHPRGYAPTSFLFANARDLPFKNNAFDKAIITYGLSAIPGNKKVLRELHRVVRPKGQICILDFGDEMENRWMGDIHLESLLQPYSKNIISKKLYDTGNSYINGFFETYILEVK